MTVTYALLTNRHEADAALDALQSLTQKNKSLKVHVLDHGAHADTIALHETGAFRGVSNGAAYGAIGSGAAVAAFTLSGIIALPFLPTFVAAIALGTFYGGFVGFIAGSSCPDLNLAKLEKQLENYEDGVLLSVACNNPTTFDDANQVLRDYNAIEGHPELF